MKYFLNIIFIFIIITFVHAQRVKRQVLGFSLGGANNNANSGQALGQAIGGTINSLLGGLLGGHSNNQPQGCARNNGGCQQGCTARGRNIRCFCNDGYVLNPDGRTCSDVDECSLNLPVPCQDLCINTDGSFTCGCSPGLLLLADGISCSPAAETCALNNGGCEQICRDRPKGGVNCRCSKGYGVGPNEKSCTDIDECSTGTHNCNSPSTCKNTPGGYECITSGLTESCNISNGGCEHRCRENKRGLSCTCRKGFDLQSDGKSCVDIDECQTGQHNCPNICLNNPGSFECTTPEQQAGCSLNNGGCEHVCRDKKKGIKCICRKGFVLQPDGKSCTTTDAPGPSVPPGPVDPCQVNNGGCDQICVNTNGVVSCQCNPGFIFSGGLCQRQIQIPSSPVVQTTQGTTLSPNPQDKGCGVNTKKSLFRRIVGGKPADPKDWPWMAAILRNAGDQQFCGGALYTDRHVLTAAHCVISFKKEDIKVRLGEYNFDVPDENNPTDFRVEDIKMHENYNQQTQENDIAILKLGRPSSFSEFIWPVCLPPPNNEFEDQLGYVTGWGTIHFGGPVSKVLQEVVIPVWKQAECVAAYPENKVTNTMMCAGIKAGGKDSCQGDSGGPFLVQIFPETRWHLIGLVSWGIECASANRPGVYTRVNMFLDWITTNTAF